MGGRGSQSGSRIAPISGKKYESFKNYSTSKKFEMDGYVKATSYQEAFQLLNKQAEHITGKKGIITDSALGGETFKSWSSSVRKHPESGNDGNISMENHFEGGELKSYWRDHADGRYHRMHIEQVDRNTFYVDFGISRDY